MKKEILKFITYCGVGFVVGVCLTILLKNRELMNSMPVVWEGSFGTYNCTSGKTCSPRGQYEIFVSQNTGAMYSWKKIKSELDTTQGDEIKTITALLDTTKRENGFAGRLILLSVQKNNTASIPE